MKEYHWAQMGSRLAPPGYGVGRARDDPQLATNDGSTRGFRCGEGSAMSVLICLEKICLKFGGTLH